MRKIIFSLLVFLPVLWYAGIKQKRQELTRWPNRKCYRELTPTIVNAFVKKIIVQGPDKSGGHRRQKMEQVWNFIGEVNLPGDDQTVERQRKGRTA